VAVKTAPFWVAAVGCAIALSACGSSSKPSGTGQVSIGIKFADCMRTHGVPDMPDPSAGGGGIQFSSNSGINPASPAFQTAQKQCGSLIPGPGSGPPQASESRKLQMIHLAACMRKHGLTSFPDPTSGPPPGPPAGGGIAFGAPGSFISVPQSMMQAPAFQQAAAVCGFPGFRGAGRGGPKPSPAGG
jgi:hypothetical protein